MSEATSYKDVTLAQINELIGRIEYAHKNHLSLTQDDYLLLLDALSSLLHLQVKIADHEITVQKLRKLIGVVSTSERLKKTDRSSTGTSNQRPPPERKKKATQQPKPVVIHHDIQNLSKADACDCGRGKYYKFDPASFIRIRGCAPFQAEKHIMSQLRCNACGCVKTAKLPEEVTKDGDADQKYGYSARSMMVLFKYNFGIPFYRQMTIQGVFGFTIPTATIFDQCEKVEQAIGLVFYRLLALSANARQFLGDDTRHLVIDKNSLDKKSYRSDASKERTGLFTSGMIAKLFTNHSVILFKTNIGNSGEFLQEILEKRTCKEVPLLMSDALSHNQPESAKVVKTLCNVHARRNFYELLDQYPEEITWVLNIYAVIWKTEKATLGFSSAKRLELHRKDSLPVMEQLLYWCQRSLKQRSPLEKYADVESYIPTRVEENSRLGKAMKYFINHYEGLSAFCRIENAEVDNNEMERALKLIVLGRKNFYFYKTQTGASISDRLSSLIATAMQYNINIFNYLTWLQRHQKHLSKNIDYFLPWFFSEEKFLLTELQLLAELKTEPITKAA